jgi:hypothetical protein
LGVNYLITSSQISSQDPIAQGVEYRNLGDQVPMVHLQGKQARPSI